MNIICFLVVMILGRFLEYLTQKLNVLLEFQQANSAFAEGIYPPFSNDPPSLIVSMQAFIRAVLLMSVFEQRLSLRMFNFIKNNHETIVKCSC